MSDAVPRMRMFAGPNGSGKIVERYYRSLNQLGEALRKSDRAFLFDTGEETPLYFAEVTNGKTIQLKSDEVPTWFELVWESF